jgi:hypothetical protein
MEPKMSRKIKQNFSSLGYRLQKFSLKVATYRPSSLVLAFIAMAAAIFLLGGGIYDLFMEPLTYIPTGGRILSYIPYHIHEQLLIGSIGVMILYVMGSAGLLLIYYSTKYVRSPRQVSLLLRIGVALLLISFMLVEAVLFWILNYPSG